MCPVAHWPSFYSLYFCVLASAQRPIGDISIAAAYPFTTSIVISVLISEDIHLPAYINNIMKKYKATTRLGSGRSFDIMCRGDCLPLTYDAHAVNILLRLYARYSLLPYFNRAGYCLWPVYDANSHIVILPTESMIPYVSYLDNLSPSCHSTLLTRPFESV